MNQQPDKFFRDKLEDYQRPAPASAWDKIISAEHKKKHRAIWLRIAASIFPLMLAGYLLWPVDQHNAPTTLASENKNDKPRVKESTPKATADTAKVRPITPATQIIAPQLAESTKSSREPGAKHQKASNANANGIPRVNDHVEKKEVLRDIYKEDVAQSTPVKEAVREALTIAEVASVDTDKKERSTVTLVYTANDVSQYLDKSFEDEATSGSKKPSTLKKLLMKANDLSAQDPFGELRQKKNEILALNFKGKGNADKTSKQ